jgi:hypothetical protein
LTSRQASVSPRERPVDHDDLLRVSEARPNLAQVGVAFLDALHGVNQPHRGTIDITAAEIEQQALTDRDEAQDHDIVAPDS